MRIRWKGFEIVVESEEDIELFKKLIEIEELRKIEGLRKAEKPRKAKTTIDYEAKINEILEKYPELKEFKEYLVEQEYKPITIHRYLYIVVRYILNERRGYRQELSPRTLEFITHVKKIYNEFLENKRKEEKEEKRGLEALFSEEDDFDLKKYLFESRKVIEDTLR